MQGTFTEMKISMELHEFKFDKRMLYEYLKKTYPDLNKDWFTMKLLRNWMAKFSELRPGVKAPKEWASDGRSMLQVVPDDGLKP